MRKLRIPCAVAFTVVATTTAIGAAISACGHGSSPPVDTTVVTEKHCDLICIPDGTDAGVCPTDPPPCADDSGVCPSGCHPIG